MIRKLDFLSSTDYFAQAWPTFFNLDDYLVYCTSAIESIWKISRKTRNSNLLEKVVTQEIVKAFDKSR